ncbi:hypothetical protein [Polyangium sp. y55x31]|uniref:hypothetical protein n=1 Tax=Polyangium sp. y55x31 TaxID=3042688 RepID=UPI00248261DD|nr:hypothetical protein [Polyangium sp. y55x31]MDI1476891.1 hypothetical protein [Polyangium sp. y55x31]
MMLRKSVLISLFAMGCTGSSAEPFDAKVTWSIKDFETGTVGCPDAFPKIRVVAQGLDENGFETGRPFVETFDCAAGSATLTLYGEGTVEREVDGESKSEETTGRYVITVQNTGELGETVHGESLPYVVDIAEGKTTVTAPISPGGNYFLLGWRLENAAGEHPSCEALGVSDVEIRYRIAGTSDALTTDRFACASTHPPLTAPGEDITGFGVSSPLAALQTYEGQVIALDASGAVRGQTDTSFTVQPPGYAPYEITNVPVTVPINP